MHGWVRGVFLRSPPFLQSSLCGLGPSRSPPSTHPANPSQGRQSWAVGACEERGRRGGTCQGLQLCGHGIHAHTMCHRERRKNQPQGGERRHTNQWQKQSQERRGGFPCIPSPHSADSCLARTYVVFLHFLSVTQDQLHIETRPSLPPPPSLPTTTTIAFSCQ